MQRSSVSDFFKAAVPIVGRTGRRRCGTDAGDVSHTEADKDVNHILARRGPWEPVSHHAIVVSLTSLWRTGREAECVVGEEFVQFERVVESLFFSLARPFRGRACCLECYLGSEKIDSGKSTLCKYGRKSGGIAGVPLCVSPTGCFSVVFFQKENVGRRRDFLGNHTQDGCRLQHAILFSYHLEPVVNALSASMRLPPPCTQVMLFRAR